MCSFKSILFVIIPLVIVYKFFPELFSEIVPKSIGFVLNSRLGHSDKNPENRVNWTILYIVVVITFVVTVFLQVVLKRNKCARFLLHSWIVTGLAVEVMLSIYIYFQFEDVKKRMLEWLDLSFNDYSKPNYGLVRIIWDDLQTMFECCGHLGPKDWLEHKDYLQKKYNSTLPNSCCKNLVPCVLGKEGDYKSYVDQCRPKSNEYISVNLELIIWALVGLGVAKIAAVLVSNFYSVQLERFFNISSTKLTNSINRTWSSKKCPKESSNISLEKC